MENPEGVLNDFPSYNMHPSFRSAVYSIPLYLVRSTPVPSSSDDKDGLGLFLLEFGLNNDSLVPL